MVAVMVSVHAEGVQWKQATQKPWRVPPSFLVIHYALGQSDETMSRIL